MHLQVYAIILVLGVLLTIVHKKYTRYTLQRRLKACSAVSTNAWYDPIGLRHFYEIVALKWTYQNYEVFSKLIDNGSATAEMSILGDSSIITAHPENIKALLSTQFEEFGKGPLFISMWQQFLGDGIFNADGTSWKHSRALLRPQFLRARVADLEVMIRHTEEFIAAIGEGPVDAFDLAFRMTLDTATHYLFGESAGTLTRAGGDQGFSETFRIVQELQTLRMQLGPFWKFVKFKHHIDDLNKYVDHYIQRALEKPEKSEIDVNSASFLDTLAQDTRDPKVLRDQVVSTLLAGRDTTAATLCWLLKRLSNDPSRYEKLRQEVLAILPDSTRPTYEQLKRMTYMKQCIDETLRLYPIVPMNIRESLTDTTLPRGGPNNTAILVPKGTAVFYVPLITHRRASIPDVEEWVPERWEEWTPEPYSYVPFNQGRRVCLGRDFAVTELQVLLSYIARSFPTLQNPGVEEYAMKYDIILTPRNGCVVQFK